MCFIRAISRWQHYMNDAKSTAVDGDFTVQAPISASSRKVGNVIKA